MWRSCASWHGRVETEAEMPHVKIVLEYPYITIATALPTLQFLEIYTFTNLVYICII